MNQTPKGEARTEPLPCPFCGGSDISDGEMLTEKVDYHTATQSECQSCGAVGPEAVLAPGEVDYGCVKAISAWNRRAALAQSRTPEPAPVVDLLHRMLETSTSQISTSWKDTIRPVLTGLLQIHPAGAVAEAAQPEPACSFLSCSAPQICRQSGKCQMEHMTARSGESPEAVGKRPCACCGGSGWED